MISERNGIHINMGTRYVADGGSNRADVTIISHAHFDHLAGENREVITSEATARIGSERTGNQITRKEDSNVTLLKAGHILGSRSPLIEGERTVLYTGDFSPRDRLYLDGFKPRDADILVMESTYGVPAYRFPDHKTIESRIADWLEDSEGPFLLFGYSLGKSQKIQKIVEKYTELNIKAHRAVQNMNSVIGSECDIGFECESFSFGDSLEKNDAVILPSRMSRSDKVNELAEKESGLKAGFSGWAATDSFKYRGGYDETFMLSDHADFDELVETVRKVDPEKVYTQHGFDEELARHLRKELGMNAVSLKKNQSRLSDF